MALIQSLTSTPINNAQTTENGQLGTDGLDFLTALLGLQADQTNEEGQDELFKSLLDSSVDTSTFGQDTALPVNAEQTQNAQILASLNLVQPQGTQTPTELPVVDVKGADTVAKATEIQTLLTTPMEDLQPDQLKELVAAVWGKTEEVKDVKVEVVEATEVPLKNSADSAQHNLLKAMAAEKAEVPAETVKSERPENLSARSEATASQSGAVAKEEVLTTKTEKKTSRPDPMAGMALPTESRADGEPAVTTVAHKADMEISGTKLTPQVLPHVEKLVEQGGGKMTLQLDPPEMGKLTIEVTTRGKNVELAIHADNDQTRSVLEGGLGDLKLALATQDLQLTHAEVQCSSESSFSSLQFGQGGSQSGQQDSSKEGGQSFFGREEKAWSRTLLNESPVARNRNAGRLDFRV